MGWQDYIVFAIGIAVAALLVRRVVCAFRRGPKACSGCGKTQCPLHGLKKRRTE